MVDLLGAVVQVVKSVNVVVTSKLSSTVSTLRSSMRSPVSKYQEANHNQLRSPASKYQEARHNQQQSMRGHVQQKPRLVNALDYLMQERGVLTGIAFSDCDFPALHPL